VCRADNLTTFKCRLSRNLGASTSWNAKGLSRSVMGLFYLYLYTVLSCTVDNQLTTLSRTKCTVLFPDILYYSITLNTATCFDRLWDHHHGFKVSLHKTELAIHVHNRNIRRAGFVHPCINVSTAHETPCALLQFFDTWRLICVTLTILNIYELGVLFDSHVPLTHFIN
jgi:hypothetical protein